ncbi:MAG: glycosyltransferase family 39 protein [Lachnospiraceae bacterium]|nr:glycosyltransferase family 39 protein [Lachnospiraceae bacterium]
MRFNFFRSQSILNTAGGVRRRLIFNIVAAAVLFYTVFFVIHILGSMLSGIHIPNEYREAANVDLTLSIIKGVNPYSSEGLQEVHPRLVFQYGPLFSLLAAGIHFLLPFIDIVVLHYIIALICVGLGAAMSLRIVRENTRTWLPGMAVFLFTIVCTWRYGYINAVPDTLAVTLLILIFYVETREHIKGKEIIEALISVALFYTKQYFVIIALSLFIYKLIVDKRACIRLTISGLAFLASSIAAVQFFCPLYFTYTLLVVHGVSGQSTGAAAPVFSYIGTGALSTAIASTEYNEPPSGWAFEWQQLKSLGGIFIFIFAGMVIGVIRAFKNRIPTFGGSRLFVIHTGVASLALLYLGQNDGAWLSYYLQLLMPSVIIYSFIAIEKVCFDDSIKSSYIIAAMGLFMFMVMFTMYRCDERLPVYDRSEISLSDWDRVYGYCDKYGAEGDVLYIAPLGFNALLNDRYLYDNGHEMAINEDFYEEYRNSDFYRKVFPQAGALMKKHLDYRDEMRERIRRQEYRLVTAVPGYETIADTTLLKQSGYELADTVTLDMGRTSYEVEFWIPMLL